jgi:hypothetical protein
MVRDMMMRMMTPTRFVDLDLFLLFRRRTTLLVHV